MVLVAVQLLVMGLYLPPVLKASSKTLPPPQTIISLPVHTAVCRIRAAGALVVLVDVQLSVLGLYLPPVFKTVALPLSSVSHFTSSPHCRVQESASGRIGECRWSPRVIGTATRGTSYYRERVGNLP